MKNEKLQVKRHFDDWAAGIWQSFYDSNNSYESYNSLARRDSVEQLLRDHSFARTLDIGCGTGEYIETVLRHGTEYHGIDFSSKMIGSAIKGAQDRSISKSFFCAADAEGLPYRDHCFDMILGIGLIEYFEDPSMVLREIRRVLTSNGMLVLQSYQYSFFDFSIAFYKALHHMISRSSRPKKSKKRKIKHRHYSKVELDSLMASVGFRRLDFRFSNFRVIPHPVEKMMIRPYMLLSDFFARICPRHLGFFAANYIAKYQPEISS